MRERRYLKQRVYRVKQKLGGLEVSLKWSLPEEKEGTPAFLSFRLAGTVDGRVRAAQVDLPGRCIPEFLALGALLKGGVSAGETVFGGSGAGCAEVRWLEVVFLGEEFLKPWEFRLFTAEGEGDLILSEPIRVRVSGRTLGNLVEVVSCQVERGR